MEEEQYVKIPLSRYTELILAEQKAEQYKKYLLSYSFKKPFMDVLLAIEQKTLFDLNKEDKKESEDKE
ncbi:MAG: hypothetical protein J6K45_06395 [Clostridia bacterium]|nr:hypothetical protein [Clostridia bacterium]